MNKKIFFGAVILFLVLVAGGFFYWWQNQADVRALNKTLPEGVRLVKSLTGDEYRVVNKIDEYEFEIPREWKGIEEIEYIPEREVEKYIVSSIGLEGVNNFATPFSIDVYNIENQSGVDLMFWAQELWNLFNLDGELQQDIVQNISVVKVFEGKNLGKTYVYFLKSGAKIYVLNNTSEEFIRYIISNGKW